MRSSIKLDKEGTKIGDFKSMESSVVYALSHKMNLAEATISGSKLSDIQKFLWSHNLQALILTEKENHKIQILSSEKACELLETKFDVTISKKGLASISIVGEGFWQEFDVMELIENKLESFDTFFIEKNDLTILCSKKNNLKRPLIFYTNSNCLSL